MSAAIRSRGQAVQVSKSVLEKIIEADTFTSMTAEEKKKYQKMFELNSNIREMLVYKLLQRIVADMNEVLKGKPEKLRLLDEGDGLYLELCT